MYFQKLAYEYGQKLFEKQALSWFKALAIPAATGALVEGTVNLTMGKPGQKAKQALLGMAKVSALPPAVSDLLLRSGIGGTLWGGYDAATHPGDRLGKGAIGFVSGVGAGASTSLARSGLKKLLVDVGEKPLGQKLMHGFGQGAAGIAGGLGGRRLMETALGRESDVGRGAGRHAIGMSSG